MQQDYAPRYRPTIALFVVLCLGILFSSSIGGGFLWAGDAELDHGRQAAILRGVQSTVAIECRQGRMGFFGTGVLISKDGHILTNITVVPKRATEIKVWIKGEDAPYNAKLLETAEAVEGVLIQIESKRQDFPHVELLDTTTLTLGSHLLTLGNPLQALKNDDQVAVSSGILSGRYKLKNADQQSQYKGEVLETDAAVNPGSDGGPILDEKGRLAAIITLGYQKERLQGCGIPVHALYKEMQQLREVVKTYYDGRLAAPVPPSDPLEQALVVAAHQIAPYVVLIDVDRDPDRLPDPPARLAPNLVPLYQQEMKQLELTLRPQAPVSGLRISADEILTSAALVTSSGRVAGPVRAMSWTGPDGKAYKVSLVASHGLMDLALLKIENYTDDRFARLDETAVPVLGSALGVIGRIQGGEEITFTKGMVSAVGRGLGFNQVRAYQTDALINYGNAGGPVVDIRGRIVGLAGHIRIGSQWGQSAGVGLFVGIKDILAALPDLRAGKSIVMPSRTFLGVQNDPEAVVDGAAVGKVLPNSAASEAGLKDGDVIIEADNRPIEEWQDLLKIVTKKRPGDRLLLVIKRGEAELEITAFLRSHQDEVLEAALPPDDLPPEDLPPRPAVPRQNIPPVPRNHSRRADDQDGLQMEPEPDQTAPEVVPEPEPELEPEPAP